MVNAGAEGALGFDRRGRPVLAAAATGWTAPECAGAIATRQKDPACHGDRSRTHLSPLPLRRLRSASGAAPGALVGNAARRAAEDVRPAAVSHRESAPSRREGRASRELVAWQDRHGVCADA